MKALKYCGYAIVGLMVLAVIVLASVAALVDGAFVKSRLERYLQEEKQRTLSIEGEPRISIFPVAGLSLGKTVLSERSSDKTFVSLDSLAIGVRVMPLLTGEVAVDALALSGLRANIVKLKDGRFNFQDLLADDRQGAKKATEGRDIEKPEPPKLRIAEIRIEGAQLSYRDESSGQELTVSGFHLKTGRLEDDTPSPIVLSAAVTGKKPEVGLKANLSGSARINLARKSFSLAKLDAKVTGNAANLRGLDLGISGDVAVDGDRNLVDVNGLQIRADGRFDRDALTLLLAVPRIEVTPSKAAGSAITGNLKIAGPQRSATLSLNVGAVSGSATALSIANVMLDIDANAEGNTVKARVSTPVLANLAASTWDLPKIVADVRLSGPMIPQKSVTLPIQAALKADLGKETLSAQVSTKFDESSVQAKLAATKLQPLNANFDIDIDRLNLDRYMRPAGEKSVGGDPPVDLGALKGRTVTGKVQIGALQAQRVKLSSIKAEIRLANGKLEVAPHSANLYEGTLSGRLSADANGNQIALKEEVKAVSINPLLRDLADKDVLEGKGDMTLDVAMSGPTVGAMKRAMNGSARLQLKDGAYKGINLAETFRKASTLGAKSGSLSADKTQRTDFSEMSASFAIKNGVAHNDDLSMKSPFVRVGGSGDIDIGNSRLDYTAKASIVATATGQQGRDSAAGLTIPVKLTGPFDAVKYDIQYGSMFSGIGSGIGKVIDAGKGAGSAAVDTVKDRLKGLFGR